MKAETPLGKIDKQLNAVLVQLWQKLKPEQKFQKLPPKKGPHVDRNQAMLSVSPLWEETVTGIGHWLTSLSKDGTREPEAPHRTNHPWMPSK